MKINIKKFLPGRKVLLKYAVILSGVLILMVSGMYGVTVATSSPDFCKTCHVMMPEYITWQASSHSQISCVKCHVDSGIVNEVKHKFVAAKELYSYVTKSYELPIIMTEPIDNSRCLQCHSLSRKATPSGDLIIPHEIHEEQDIACIKCHQGVAHGKIASRGETVGGDFKKWDVEKGRQLMTEKYTVPRMDLCMDCHQRRNVTVSCDACHTSDLLPESHRQKSFATNHGPDARKSIDYCATCHDYITASGAKSLELEEQGLDIVSEYLAKLSNAESTTSVAGYAANNSYCVECHQKRPPSHSNEWPYQHGKAANKGANTESCMICHSPRTDVQGTTNQGACSACHPSIHKYDWRPRHPVPVPPQKGRLDKTCFQCHVQDTCTACHGTK